MVWDFSEEHCLIKFIQHLEHYLTDDARILEISISYEQIWKQVSGNF